MKLRVETDLHVRVDIVAPHGLGIDYQRSELEDFVRAIKNHRDLDGYRAYVDWTSEYRCSFCGGVWEVWGDAPDPKDPEYDPDLPVCCDAAQQEYVAQKAEVAP